MTASKRHLSDRDNPSRRPSRSKRSQVRGDRHHVLSLQIGHRGFHELRCHASTRAVLDVVKLAHDIAWRTPYDRGYPSQTFQILSMADCALECLAVTAGTDQCRTFCDTAYWHISYELRSWVPVFKLFEIFGHLDYAFTDWLLFTGIGGGQKPSGDKRLRDGISFDNPDI